jgi:hypothetical protein
MKFRLIFEGAIPPRPRSSLAEIHRIRLKMAPQLETLWNFDPLVGQAKEWIRHPTENPGDYAILEQRGSSVFAPLISKSPSLSEMTFSANWRLFD